MNVSLKSWDSKNLLLNHLANYQRSVLIGNDVEASRGYYTFSLEDFKNPIQVGVIINQPKEPSIFLLPTFQYAIFGYDQSISVLDLDSSLLVGIIPLEGLFFEFVQIEKWGLILALHELGCIALSEQCEVLWRHVTDDILEDWSTDNDSLDLLVMNNENPKVLMLPTGKPLHTEENF